ncbi:cell division protein FtsK [Streptomyces caelestis]|uniref:Cell division protein FtsK n=1 Tax=Streptomyces caelestis TaxID=36816 RepID=A0A0M8QH57_9ACTN|nr:MULTISPECIES: FHA domain-containing protein [Streptomyces]KOT36135.1 cell division protein FtsK [Streptomyces caelestis]
MQIRLTVVDPLGPSSPARERAASCDVLVTAPAGTALAAVASALASVLPGGDGPSGSSGTPVLYAGDRRLDAQRCTLGEPPLIDGAVLAVGAPGEPEPHPELDGTPTRLHVVAGPDAGGVHLLHGGEIRIGRSADADVPLDDPDVSRLHCAVTVAPDGGVSVADLGSTNGTTLDGRRVGPRPVRLAPGALLRIGESALRLTPAAGPRARAATTPDGEGHVRVPSPARRADDGDAHPRVTTPTAPTHHAHGSADRAVPAQDARRTPDAPRPDGAGGPPRVPSQGRVPGIERTGTAPGGRAVHTVARGDVPRLPQGRRVSRPRPADGDTHTGRSGASAREADPGAADRSAGTAPDGARGGTAQGAAPDRGPGGPTGPTSGPTPGSASGRPTGPTTGPVTGHMPTGAPPAPYEESPGTRKGTPVRGTELPRPGGGRRRGGLTAWARRLTGGRQEPEAAWTAHDEEGPGAAPDPGATAPAVPETWPDPATLLLTALGPGPRLWERGPGHPEALAVRLGTADRPAPDGSGLLPAVPVTSGLREVGALGLAGPRERLAGLARAVLAQLAALHSPDSLELVLIAADPSRPLAERTAEWSWLGWLPHVRPGHGQDCRLLLAHDREQAAARAEELLRRLEDHAPAAPRISGGGPHEGPHEERCEERYEGPYTVVVVDGDPDGPEVGEAVARLALEGPQAGIHVVCLAETAAASPASPVTETYEAACAAAPAFRRCGAVALLSGDVATALRLLRVAGTGSGRPPGPVGHGTLATVDAVSPAWAERFARALAPLRTDGAGGERHARVSAPLPPSARLLDELGLARATPASLMARWADAADDAQALGGRVTAVLGAGPRGPVVADLAADGPHLLVEGPSGSGRTELLRAVVASLAAAERPDRLAVVLVDGRGAPTAGAASGEGLRVCTDVPHVTTHLCANDPVRMREFAQSLNAELKRRAELLGRSDFAEWHTGRELSDRMVAQRTAASRAGAGPAVGGERNGDLDTPSSSTLRLRPGADRRKTGAVPPLPRLVVVVDDLDALVSPALGSPGRPAAGSVMRALEAVARDGERLGVHLVAATGPCARTAQTEPVRQATLRVALDAAVPGGGPDEPAPGRGRLARPDGRVTAFQGGRVTGRIPRTATLRPTVVPLEWHRMGDPPARRQVRELGNGPTDLALLASALERAARQVVAAEVPSLL